MKTRNIYSMQLTGAKLKEIREVKGISVEEVRIFLGLESRQAIYRWESGVTFPEISNLANYCVLLGVPMEEVLIIECNQQLNDNH